MVSFIEWLRPGSNLYPDWRTGSPEEFLPSLMPRQPGAKPPLVRPRPVAKRVWASLQRESWEVVAEATLEAERQDPEHVKRWVVRSSTALRRNSTSSKRAAPTSP